MVFDNRLCAAVQIARNMERHHQRLSEIARGTRRDNMSRRVPSDPNALRPSRRPSHLSAQREVEVLRRNQADLARLQAIEAGQKREREHRRQQRLASGRAIYDGVALRERRLAQRLLAEANTKHRERIANTRPRIVLTNKQAAVDHRIRRS